jgi:hypothetical protein
MQTELKAIFKPLILAELKVRQKAFNANPNAENWTRVLRAMITHQQLDWAVRSPSIDHGKLMFDLKQNSDWDEVICRATLGMTCADAIKL